MIESIKIFFAALSFQTRLPIPHSWAKIKDDSWGLTPWTYPVVAYVIAFILVVFTAFAQVSFQPVIGSALILAFYTWLTGGLHIDGLADSFDGFGSNQPPEKTLVIMKDSCSGVMGVIAIVLNFILKFAIFHALYKTQTLILLVFLMPIFGRNSLILGMSFNKYAREDGIGKALWRQENGIFIWSTLSLVIPLILLLELFQTRLQGQIILYDSAFNQLAQYLNLFNSYAFIWVLAFILVYIHIVSNAYWSRYCRQKILGGTGDTLGAGAEISEIIFGVSFLFLLI